MTLQSHRRQISTGKQGPKLRVHTLLCSLQHCSQQPRHGSNRMPIDRGTDKDVAHIHSRDYSATEKNELMPSAAPWMA